jgi:septal ring factor EnvC (AmiA/AmiB activator)
VSEPDPIKQLQHLLEDPGRVLERISRIQSAIGAITPSSSSAPELSAATSARAETTIILKSEDRPYDGLLQMLRDMQSQIEQRVRPLALLTVQSEVEHLRELSKQEQTALDECVAQLDRNILTCVDRIEESRKLHAELTTVNQRLEELGAPTEGLPDFPTSQDSKEILKSRIERLRGSGKI